MDTFKDKLKKIQELLDSNLISSEEYYKLREEILEEEEEDESVIKLNKKLKKTQQSQNLNIQRIKSAGSDVLGIFYCIIFQILIIFGYWFLIGFKIGYSEASGQTENIGSFLGYIKNLNYVFYFVEFVIALRFMVNLFNLGVNLKYVDK